MIQVTKTYLPSLDEYVAQLRSLWRTGQIANHGALAERLERELCNYLGVRHVFLICNGTVALQIAIRALDLRGEVVTTPFSYVATTSSLVWEGCTPVFADIDLDTLCIDPAKVEAACGESTSGIVATHVYGNACDVERLSEIARRRSVRLLFDAAHSFGAEYRGRSVSAWGDAAILSFHATKLFHTGEGGAIVTDDDEIAHKVSYLRNFGHRGQEEFWGLGINGKMSELHAAMGLSIFPHFQEILAEKRRLTAAYDTALADVPLATPKWRDGLIRNCAYYPVLFSRESSLLAARDQLNAIGIFPRRYFLPALTELPYLTGSSAPVAEDVSRRVLCLPMGHDVGEQEIAQIADVLHAVLKRP